jgi:hypothetical protein
MSQDVFILTPAQRNAIRDANLAEHRAKLAAADRRHTCNSRRFTYGCRCGLVKGHKGECVCPNHGCRWPFSRW